MIPESAWSDDAAWERGRVLAAQAIAHNPDQRRHVEEMFGLEVCNRYFPEVYAPKNAFRRVLDKILPFTLKRVDS